MLCCRRRRTAFQLVLAISLVLASTRAFTVGPSVVTRISSSNPFSVPTSFPRADTCLYLAAAQRKKRRRRRKAPVPEPAATTAEAPAEAAPPPPPPLTPDPVKTSLEELEGDDGDDDDDDDEDVVETEDDLIQLQNVASFEFKADDAIAMGVVDDVPTQVDIPAADDAAAASSDGGSSDSIPLPDIRDARRKKQMEQELAAMEAQKEASRVKIKRSDKEAFTKLLEQQPFADADDSFFEKEEYGTVSALLGEGAKPFLGIPTGPLQVGHFIGALGIMLMAFVEYPGFPLTNLPTPLRASLQGGLGTVYSINLVLAVLAVFKANERGQPTALWAAKTFSVGGLALDQLTQLPTLEQIKRRKAQKGKRALRK